VAEEGGILKKASNVAMRLCIVNRPIIASIRTCLRREFIERSVELLILYSTIKYLTDTTDS